MSQMNHLNLMNLQLLELHLHQKYLMNLSYQMNHLNLLHLELQHLLHLELLEHL